MNAHAADPSPWYRHPWPWILMGGPFVVVLASFASLWLAVKSADGLVAEDYYKQGLAINKTLARAERAQALGLDARLALRDGRVEAKLSSRSGAELPARIRVTFSHVAQGGVDHALLLAGEKGFYSGAASLPAGHWQVVIEDEMGDWRLAGPAQLAEGGEIVLHGVK